MKLSTTNHLGPLTIEAGYFSGNNPSALSKRALTKVALGYNLGDEELQREGTEKFMQLAQAHPEMVKASMLRRTIVGATKSQYNADTHGVGQAGRLSQEVLEAVGE